LTEKIQKLEKYLKPQLFEQLEGILDVFMTRLQYEAVNASSDAQKGPQVIDQLEKINFSLVSKLTNSVRDCLDQELAIITQNVSAGTLGSVPKDDMHKKLSGFIDIGNKKLTKSNIFQSSKLHPENRKNYTGINMIPEERNLDTDINDINLEMDIDAGLDSQINIQRKISNARNYSNRQTVGKNRNLTSSINQYGTGGDDDGDDPDYTPPSKNVGLKSVPMV
jgi:hypothetical protein